MLACSPAPFPAHPLGSVHHSYFVEICFQLQKRVVPHFVSSPIEGMGCPEKQIIT